MPSIKKRLQSYIDTVTLGDTKTAAEARKALYLLAGTAVALPIEAERKLLQAAADNKAVGNDEEAKEAQKLARERRSDSIDRLAPAVYATLNTLGQVEGVNLRKLSDEDKECFSLEAANLIVAYWLRKPETTTGRYELNATFIRSHVRDFIRSGWIFGRLDRTK